jgi:hypothetical protein
MKMNDETKDLELYILWQDLHNSYDLEELIAGHKKVFEPYSIEEMENICKSLALMERREHFPQNTLVELVELSMDYEQIKKFYSQFNYSIVYNGRGDNYRDLLIAINTVLLHMDQSEKYPFLHSLWSSLKYINKRVAKKLGDLIVKELHYMYR